VDEAKPSGKVPIFGKSQRYSGSGNHGCGKVASTRILANDLLPSQPHPRSEVQNGWTRAELDVPYFCKEMPLEFRAFQHSFLSSHWNLVLRPLGREFGRFPQGQHTYGIRCIVFH
jgi:hypothetical protein